MSLAVQWLTPHLHCRGQELTIGWGTPILHAVVLHENIFFFVFSQYLSSQGVSPLVPESLADALRLLTGSPLPTVHMFLSLVFLCSNQLSFHAHRSEVAFLFPAVVYFSWIYFPLVFKVRYFRGLSLLHRI